MTPRRKEGKCKHLSYHSSAHCCEGVCVGVFSSVLVMTVSVLSTGGNVTGVGAILLFFVARSSSTSGTACRSRFFAGDAPSSRSDSLPLRKPEAPGRPLTELLALCVPWPWAGVKGGVNMGTPTGPEFAAASPGTEDMEGVGAFIVPMSPAPGANDEAVAMLETELLLAGLPGLTGMKELGSAGKPADGCFEVLDAVAVIEADILGSVGVGVGVEWFDDCDAAVLSDGVLWCLPPACGPLYFSPSSPGANVNEEQNPSEELMRRVSPSLDLLLLVHTPEMKKFGYVPREIREGSKVQITNDAQRLLLLRIVDVHRVLGRNGVHHAIGKAKGRDRSRWRVAWCSSFLRLR